ncbi:MAG: pseudouridine-5'-phosphate glycosidase [Flavobacteriales bacterium]|jgi:pseudouridine-5'-phosphate glycosidase
MFPRHLNVKDEVRNALAEGKPVLALESTIIAHGMPYPKNMETALKVEKIVRDGGVIPATIAVMNGQIHIGLTNDELAHLAKAENVMKLSRRDLPFALAQNKLGATTVASTMIASAMAGIEVFATGGIGGVHRGAEKTWDVSADLIELSNTNVTVICAGAKAILDLPKTMEYLETFGVPVIGFGTKELPAFYSRNSGIPLEMSVASPEELAHLIETKRALGLNGGILVVNPIPEAYNMDFGQMEKVIEKALDAASKKGIHGKAVTPFLLKTIKDFTSGQSLASNIELMLNNAQLGAAVAVALCVESGRD